MDSVLVITSLLLLGGIIFLHKYYTARYTQVKTALRNCEKQFQACTTHASKHEERYRILAETAQDDIFIINRDDRVEYVNSFAARQLGYTPEELIGKSRRELFPPDIAEQQWHILQTVFNTGQPVRAESRIIAQNQEIWLDNQLLPIANESGEIQAVMGISRNITEQKQAEERLKESELRFRLLAENAQDLIYRYRLTSPPGFEYVSPSATRMIGYTPEEHYADPTLGFKLVHPDDRPLLEAMISSSLSFNKPLILRWVRKDGTILWTEQQNVPIYDDEGHLVCIEGMARDITERKQTEERLQRYAAELHDANAELSQYAYVVSHDLKSPLRALHNYVLFLREDLGTTLNKEHTSYLEGMEQAIHEAEALIRDILELSRVGRHHVNVETIEMRTFLQSLLASLDLPADTEIVMAHEWPAFQTEVVLLRQVFQNLITNAVKFNLASPKRLELGWQAVSEQYYEFYVRDNGIGIDPEHHDKIFRVFERLHTKEEFEGTGIGLAIVKKAVARLGGTVRVESIPGTGSTFFVTLPKIQTQDR